MDNEYGLVIPEEVFAKISKPELKALEKYVGRPGLAVSVQAQFFELFVNGCSCEEIHRLNPNFPFGAIVRARVEGRWDERKAGLVNHALETVRAKVEQTQVAAINFNADLLQAAHKQFGDKLKRYIQTGDENVLGSLQISTLRQYKEAVEMFLKLTGQDGGAKKDGAPRSPVPGTVTTPATGDRSLTATEADIVMQHLLTKGII